MRSSPGRVGREGASARRDELLFVRFQRAFRVDYFCPPAELQDDRRFGAARPAQSSGRRDRACGTNSRALRRDRRALFFLSWIGAVLMGVLMVGPEPARYSTYWIPAFAALAATLLVGVDVSLSDVINRKYLR